MKVYEFYADIWGYTPLLPSCFLFLLCRANLMIGINREAWAPVGHLPELPQHLYLFYISLTFLAGGKP